MQLLLLPTHEKSLLSRSPFKEPSHGSHLPNPWVSFLVILTQRIVHLLPALHPLWGVPVGLRQRRQLHVEEGRLPPEQKPPGFSSDQDCPGTAWSDKKHAPDRPKTPKPPPKIPQTIALRKPGATPTNTLPSCLTHPSQLPSGLAPRDAPECLSFAGGGGNPSNESFRFGEVNYQETLGFQSGARWDSSIQSTPYEAAIYCTSRYVVVVWAS